LFLIAKIAVLLVFLHDSACLNFINAAMFCLAIILNNTNSIVLLLTDLIKVIIFYTAKYITASEIYFTMVRVVQ